MTHLITDNECNGLICDFQSEKCTKTAIYTVIMHVFDQCHNTGFALCAQHTAEVLQRYARNLPYQCGCGTTFTTLHEATEVSHINMGAAL